MKIYGYNESSGKITAAPLIPRSSIPSGVCDKIINMVNDTDGTPLYAMADVNGHKRLGAKYTDICLAQGNSIDSQVISGGIPISTSTTLTIPADVKSIIINAIAGGGGGASEPHTYVTYHGKAETPVYHTSYVTSNNGGDTIVTSSSAGELVRVTGGRGSSGGNYGSNGSPFSGVTEEYGRGGSGYGGAGNGGNGGSIFDKHISVTPGDTLSIQIGAGGSSVPYTWTTTTGGYETKGGDWVPSVTSHHSTSPGGNGANGMVQIFFIHDNDSSSSSSGSTTESGSGSSSININVGGFRLIESISPEILSKYYDGSLVTVKCSQSDNWSVVYPDTRCVLVAGEETHYNGYFTRFYYYGVIIPYRCRIVSYTGGTTSRHSSGGSGYPNCCRISVMTKSEFNNAFTYFSLEDASSSPEPSILSPNYATSWSQIIPAGYVVGAWHPGLFDNVKIQLVL